MKTNIILILTVLTVFIVKNPALSNDNNKIAILKTQKTLVAPKGTAFQWFYNGSKIKNADIKTLQVEKSGKYTVKYINHEGKKEEKQVYIKAHKDKIVQVFIIGDSTASFYDSTRFPRAGWAMALQPFFDENRVKALNKALSGRSSKSFFTDPNGWPQVKKKIKENDYLFIQFGHNDSKPDKERHTEPYSSYQEYLKKYIKFARSKGAHPVLLTSIHRNRWYDDKIWDTHGQYPPAMRQLAEKMNVPLIDLHKKTESLFEKLGKSYVTDSVFLNLLPHQYPNYPKGNVDNSHLHERGAFYVSGLVADELNALTDYQNLDYLRQSIEKAGYVDVQINNPLHGNIKGEGTYQYGENAILKAKPSKGYEFDYWMKNGQIISNKKSYSFELNKNWNSIKVSFSKQ